MTVFDSLADLQEWLVENGINTTFWGKGYAKTVVNLWNELVWGEVIIQDDPPLRLVNVVQIIIHRSDYILVEAEQEFGSGQRRFRSQPLSEKMRPGENHMDAALRGLKEELGVDKQDVTFITSTYEQIQKASDVGSYPGLRSEYTFHIIEAEIAGLPEIDFWRENAAFTHDDPVKRHKWVWLPVKNL